MRRNSWSSYPFTTQNQVYVSKEGDSFLLCFWLVSLRVFLYSCMATANITKISPCILETYFLLGFLLVIDLKDQPNKVLKWILRLPKLPISHSIASSVQENRLEKAGLKHRGLSFIRHTRSQLLLCMHLIPTKSHSGSRKQVFQSLKPLFGKRTQIHRII